MSVKGLNLEKEEKNPIKRTIISSILVLGKIGKNELEIYRTYYCFTVSFCL